MKHLLGLAILAISTFTLNAQTADDVINKYLAAAGGKEKLQNIRTLQFVQNMTISTPMGDLQMTMTNIKVESKLFRMTTASDMMGNMATVVTDTSGWIMIPPNQFTGSEAILEKLKPEQINGFRSQMACEGYFPELVNYANKGYTAELIGEGKSGGKPSYKVKLKKDKDERIYFIDKITGLVNGMTIKGAAAAAMMGMGNGSMGGRADKAELTFVFSDYTEVSGIMFPGKMTVETPMGTAEAKIGFVTINQPVDEKWYRVQ